MLEFIIGWAVLYAFFHWLIHGSWWDLLPFALMAGLIIALL